MKLNSKRGEYFQFLRKSFLVMRITLYFILLSSAFAFSSNSYAQDAKLSLQMNNAAVKEVLKAIEDQSEFIFFYQDQQIDLNRKVNIVVEKKSVQDILDQLFVGTANVYMIKDRQITIGRSQKLLINKDLTTESFTIKEQQQQKREISGTVKDSKDLPLPGVSVVVKGTTIGVITDNDGNFRLSVPNDSKSIVFSFIGMKVQEILILGKTQVNVVMEEEATALDEVVAIGYGTARRKDLTGSVSSVSASALKDIPVTSVAQAIAGRMAGVQVTKTEGSPDAEIKIRIRGGGSLTQDNSPLFIVDGFPVSNINYISPTEISSVDILKDASSTAIYGARGANGVILITTKGGFEGKGKISYNAYYGVKEIAKTLDVLDPYEFVFLQYELQPNINSTRYYGDFNDYGLYKQMKGKNWQQEVLGRTGSSQSHNLSFSGGSKIFKYNLNLTNNNEKEIMIGSKYTQTNILLNTQYKLNDWLTIDFNTRMSDYFLSGAGTSAGYRLQFVVQHGPVEGLSDFVDQDLLNIGDLDNTSQTNLNPSKMINDDYRRIKNQTINFVGAANIKFTKNLSYRFEYGTQFGTYSQNRFFGLNTSDAINYGSQPLASIQKSDSKSYRMANILTYKLANFLPGSNLTAMLGEELNNYHSIAVASSAKYFPKYIDAVSALSMMGLGTADPIGTSDNPEIKTSSFFGRLNYDYKGKYLASATLRADGSSKFAPGKQWGYFPSAALAWRISDEKFLKSTMQWLSDLKFRVSYGESGNNNITDNAWKKTFTVKSDRLAIGANESLTPYIDVNSILSNPELKWETTITRNIGVDFGLFKQRLSGSVEVYKNTTKDLLISATIPSSTGYANQWQNIGQTSNRGLEIVLNGVLIEKKDFRLTTAFNIGFNQNKIDKLGATKKWEQIVNIAWGAEGLTGNYLIEEGKQLGLMYGYETEGMYSFDDFNYANGVYTLKTGVSNNNNVVGPSRFWPGTLKFKDQNGDFVVDGVNDRKVIGNANPKHTGGFTLTAQYKGFDFSAFFNWVYGNDIYNANKLQFTSASFGTKYQNLLSNMNSDNAFTYYSKETGGLVSDPVKLAEMNINAKMWSPIFSRLPVHSWAIEDGSFLRLNTITIGYSFPKNILNKLKISKLRVYASTYNIWTWTNYSGYDPEVDTQRSTPLTPGIDWCAYPRSRSVNFGLNLEF